MGQDEIQEEHLSETQRDGTASPEETHNSDTQANSTFEQPSISRDAAPPAADPTVEEAPIEPSTASNHAALQEQWEEYHAFSRMSNKDQKKWRKRNPGRDDPSMPLESEPALNAEPEAGDDADEPVEQSSAATIEPSRSEDAPAETQTATDTAALQELWDEWHKFSRMSNKEKKAWRKKNLLKEEPTMPEESEPSMKVGANPAIEGPTLATDVGDDVEAEEAVAKPVDDEPDFGPYAAPKKKGKGKEGKKGQAAPTFEDEAEDTAPTEALQSENSDVKSSAISGQTFPASTEDIDRNVDSAFQLEPQPSSTHVEARQDELQEQWDEWHKWTNMNSKDKKKWRKNNPTKDEPFEPLEPEPASAESAPTAKPEAETAFESASEPPAEESGREVEFEIVDQGESEPAVIDKNTNEVELQEQWDDWYKWTSMSSKDKKKWRKNNPSKDEPFEPLEPEPALAPRPGVSADAPLESQPEHGSPLDVALEPLSETFERQPDDHVVIHEQVTKAASADKAELQEQWDAWHRWDAMNNKQKKKWRKDNPDKEEP
ncbi:hypothetical protein LTS18_009474, partial [Coniosporium uncinatum]